MLTYLLTLLDYAMNVEILRLIDGPKIVFRHFQVLSYGSKRRQEDGHRPVRRRLVSAEDCAAPRRLSDSDNA